MFCHIKPHTILHRFSAATQSLACLAAITWNHVARRNDSDVSRARLARNEQWIYSGQGRGKDRGHFLLRVASHFRQAAAFLQGPDHHTEASQGLLIFRGVGVGIGWSRRLGFVVFVIFVVLLLTLFSELIPYRA